MVESPDNGKYQALVDSCFELYRDFKKSDYRDKKIQEIKDCIKRYEQDAPKATFPWPDAFSWYLPLITITIDNLEPRLVAGLVGKDPVVSFGDNLDEIEELLEDWYNDELRDVVKIRETARTCVHTILKEGTWFNIPRYDYNEKVVTDFVYDERGQIIIDEAGEPVLQSASETLFEGGVVDTISFTDIYCADDLGTRNEWEKADKIRTIRPTYAELMEAKNKKGYMNIGSWLLSAKTQRRLEDKSPDQQIAGVDISGKETIECIECHISFPVANLKKDPSEEHEQTNFTETRVIATIAMRTKTIIRFVLQGELNMNNESLIKRVRLYPEEGRSFGTNIYGKMKAIQDGSSEMFSLLMNIAMICMMPWYFYEEGSGVAGDQFIYPGAGIKVEDINKIKFPDFNINPNQYIEFINLWFQLWERLGGISDPQVGKPTAEKKTATEIMSVIEEGNIKHNYQSKTFKEEFLDIVRTLYDLYYQYMPYDKTIEVQGEEMPFPRGKMKRPDNFRLTGSTESSNKLIERKENEDLYGQLRGDPVINPITLVKDILKSYNRDNEDEYINPQIAQLIQAIEQDPNIMQVIMQAVQQHMSQGVEGGQGGIQLG